MAMSAWAVVVVRLTLLGEPFSELLRNLKGVVVNDLAAGCLLSVDRRSALPFLDLFLNLFDDLVALAVADVGDCAALVMPDMAADSHEY